MNYVFRTYKFNKQLYNLTVQAIMDTHAVTVSGLMEIYLMRNPKTDIYYITDKSLIVGISNLNYVDQVIKALVMPHIRHLQSREHKKDLRQGVAKEELNMLLLTQADRDVLLDDGTICWTSSYWIKENGWKKIHNPINTREGMPMKIWQGQPRYHTTFPLFTMDVTSKKFYMPAPYKVVPSFMFKEQPELQTPLGMTTPQLFGMQLAYVNIFRHVMGDPGHPSDLPAMSIILERKLMSDPSITHGGFSFIPFPGFPEDIIVGAAHFVLDEGAIAMLRNLTSMFSRRLD